MSCTLISRNYRDVFSSRRDAQDLIPIHCSLYFSQIPKGTGDSRREIGNISHLHQQLNTERRQRERVVAAISTAVFSIKLHQVHSRWPEHKAMAQTVSQRLALRCRWAGTIKGCQKGCVSFFLFWKQMKMDIWQIQSASWTSLSLHTKTHSHTFLLKSFSGEQSQML